MIVCENQFFFILIRVTECSRYGKKLWRNINHKFMLSCYQKRKESPKSWKVNIGWVFFKQSEAYLSAADLSVLKRRMDSSFSQEEEEEEDIGLERPKVKFKKNSSFTIQPHHVIVRQVGEWRKEKWASTFVRSGGNPMNKTFLKSKLFLNSCY